MSFILAMQTPTLPDKYKGCQLDNNGLWKGVDKKLFAALSFFKLEDELEGKPRRHLSSFRVRPLRHKGKSSKAWQRKGLLGLSFLIQELQREARKVWTKEHGENKGRWIIQYSLLLDSFVILRNRLLESTKHWTVQNVSFCLKMVCAHSEIGLLCALLPLVCIEVFGILRAKNIPRTETFEQDKLYVY